MLYKWGLIGLPLSVKDRGPSVVTIYSGSSGAAARATSSWAQIHSSPDPSHGTRATWLALATGIREDWAPLPSREGLLSILLQQDADAPCRLQGTRRKQPLSPHDYQEQKATQASWMQTWAIDFGLQPPSWLITAVSLCAYHSLIPISGVGVILEAPTNGEAPDMLQITLSSTSSTWSKKSQYLHKPHTKMSHFWTIYFIPC